MTHVLPGRSFFSLLAGTAQMSMWPGQSISPSSWLERGKHFLSKLRGHVCISGVDLKVTASVFPHVCSKLMRAGNSEHNHLSTNCSENKAWIKPLAAQSFRQCFNSWVKSKWESFSFFSHCPKNSRNSGDVQGDWLLWKNRCHAKVGRYSFQCMRTSCLPIITIFSLTRNPTKHIHALPQNDLILVTNRKGLPFLQKIPAAKTD